MKKIKIIIIKQIKQNNKIKYIKKEKGAYVAKGQLNNFELETTYKSTAKEIHCLRKPVLESIDIVILIQKRSYWDAVRVTTILSSLPFRFLSSD